MGWAGDLTEVKNCLVTAQIYEEVINDTRHIIINAPKDSGNDCVSNCYYVYPYGNATPKGAKPVTMEQIESGEVCYRLNLNEDEYGWPTHRTTFRQNIGEDKYPVYDVMHGLVEEIPLTGYAGWSPGLFNEELGEPNNRLNVQLPQGVKAYAGTIRGKTLVLHPVDILNRSQGYVLKGNPGYYSMMPTNEQSTNVKNNLDGSKTNFMSGGGCYILDAKDGVVGFYEVPYGDRIENHTAYMHDTGVWVDMFPLCFDGDVNGDGTVDISDYIGVANHILGNTPDGFNADAADVNGDGAIDISDYIGVANIILTGKP